MLALAAVGYLVFVFLEATAQLERQDRQLDEQQELIDQKQTFGAAMASLVEVTEEFDGVLAASVVPVDQYRHLIVKAWAHRWDASALDRDIADARAAEDELLEVLAAAEVEASTNVSGTVNESVIDRLGAGFVATAFDDADSLCESDVLGCVHGANPLIVHFDAADNAQPYLTDWLRTGLAYHEFAHVLQFTNPEPTETALEFFDGDAETMADCFALTYLDGWTLDHRIWVSSYEYWDVSMGYGYTCNATQKQAVRDWYGDLGFEPGPISHE